METEKAYTQEALNEREQDFGTMPNGFLPGVETDRDTLTRQRGKFLSTLHYLNFETQEHRAFIVHPLSENEAAPPNGLIRTIKDTRYHFQPASITKDASGNPQILLPDGQTSLLLGLDVLVARGEHLILMKSKPSEPAPRKQTRRRPKAPTVIFQEKQVEKKASIIKEKSDKPKKVLPRKPQKFQQTTIHPVIQELFAFSPKTRRAIIYSLPETEKNAVELVFTTEKILPEVKNKRKAADKLNVSLNNLYKYLHRAYRYMSPWLKSATSIRDGEAVVFADLLPEEIVKFLLLPKDRQTPCWYSLSPYYRRVLSETYNLTIDYANIPFEKKLEDIAETFKQKLSEKMIYIQKIKALNLLQRVMQEDLSLPDDVRAFWNLPKKTQNLYLDALPKTWRRDFISRYNLDLKFGNVPFVRDFKLFGKSYRKKARFTKLVTNIENATKRLTMMIEAGAPISPEPRH